MNVAFAVPACRCSSRTSRARGRLDALLRCWALVLIGELLGATQVLSTMPRAFPACVGALFVLVGTVSRGQNTCGYGPARRSRAA